MLQLPSSPLETEQTRNGTPPQCRRFQQRETLPSTPNLLWQIESGLVRSITWNDRGKTIALGVWGSGSIVGESLSELRPYVVECLTTVEAIAFPPNMALPPEAMLERARCIEQLHCIMHIKSSKLRLLAFLRWLTQRFGRLQANWYHLPVHLSHQILAEAIGVERVTVTRMLSELERDGCLQRPGKRYLPVSPSAEQRSGV